MLIISNGQLPPSTNTITVQVEFLFPEDTEQCVLENPVPKHGVRMQRQPDYHLGMKPGMAMVSRFLIRRSTTPLGLGDYPPCVEPCGFDVLILMTHVRNGRGFDLRPSGVIHVKHN